MLGLLRQVRLERGVKQTDLMQKLRIDQSTISRIETGDRRLDAIELRNYCLALGISFPEFVAMLEASLAKSPASN